jgi:hypothetical protein
MATRHIEGSSTRAPREETVGAPAQAAAPAVPVAAAVAVADVPSAEYAETNTRSDEEV